MTRDAPMAAGERRALELLPWYVNGTLTGDELEEVRLALRSSLTLRREYDRLVHLRGVMMQDDAELAATDRAFERLMTRIQKRRAWQQPVFWPAAAALMVAVTGLSLWWNAARLDSPPAFETLAAAERDAAGAVRLRVVFAAGVPQDAQRALLAAHGLTETAPPTPAGVHTLRVPAGADARAIADALRADPRIAFASTPPADSER